MSQALVASLCYGFGGLAFGGLAALLAVRSRGNDRARLLTLACAVTAVWQYTGLAVALYPEPSVVLVHFLADGARFVVWMGFLLHLLPAFALVGRSVSLSGRLRWVLAIVLLAVLWALGIGSSFISEHPGIALNPQAPMLTAFAVASVGGLMLCEQLYRGTGEAGRWAVKPLCLALAAMFGFDLFVFSDALLLKELNVQIWIVRGVLHAFVIPLLFVATKRNRDWTVDVAVSRQVMFSSTALLLSGLYMLAVAGAGYFVRFFGGGWGTAVQVTVVFAATLALAVLAFSRTVRARLRVFINKHFYAYRYDYREEWLKFTNFLSSAADDGDMETRSIHALADLVESPGGAQWWRDERGDFRQSGRWNMPADLPTIPADDPFIGFLARTGWVVDVQDFMRRRDAYPGMEPPGWLLALGNAWIVIPLPVADGLGGLVVLTKPRTPVELNWEVLDLLKTAAKQAASVISQVRLAEALVEAQQFSAFNRMSAFVVHDLKNLVAQLSLMLKNAERHAANPEFQKDMRETIEHVVQRMQRLLLQLRSGTAPIENPAPVDVGAVIAGIKGAWGRQGRTVTAAVGDELWAMGHTDRLERVLGHLVQNAFDAMEGRGTVDIEARQDGSFVLIEVRDHGKGMTPQFIRDELFKPFRSTKATGMGIGAYESQQYIQELGGRITVESEVGVGTRFRVSLPARDRKEASLDNDDKAA